MSAFLSSVDAIAALATYWGSPSSTISAPRNELSRAIGCASLAAGKGWPAATAATADRLIRLANGSPARACFELLLAENVASLQSRYPSCPEMWQAAESYRYRPSQAVSHWQGRRQTGRLVGILKGYEYQSCEHDGWRHSIAYQICQQITSRLLEDFAALTGGADTWASFDEADFLADALQGAA